MDELQLLREYRPPAAGPAPHVVRAARTNFVEVIALEAIEFDRPPRRRRHRSRLALGVAIATAAAVVAGVVVGTGPRGGPVRTGAASALVKLSRVALVEPLPGHGDVVHTKVVADYNNGGLEQRETWIAPDGSMRLITTGGVGGDGDYRQEPQANRYPDWRDWPTDPAGVLERLRSAAAKTDMRPVDFEAFQEAADALRASAAPAAIRAAFFEAVAQLDGVTALGSVHDRSGREGVGFQVQSDASHNTRLELIFDPNTAQLIGERESAIDGTWSTWADYVVAEFVDVIPPGGTLQIPIPPG